MRRTRRYPRVGRVGAGTHPAHPPTPTPPSHLPGAWLLACLAATNRWSACSAHAASNPRGPTQPHGPCSALQWGIASSSTATTRAAEWMTSRWVSSLLPPALAPQPPPPLRGRPPVGPLQQRQGSLWWQLALALPAALRASPPWGPAAPCPPGAPAAHPGHLPPPPLLPHWPLPPPAAAQLLAAGRAPEGAGGLRPGALPES